MHSAQRLTLRTACTAEMQGAPESPSITPPARPCRLPSLDSWIRTSFFKLRDPNFQEIRLRVHWRASLGESATAREGKVPALPRLLFSCTFLSLLIAPSEGLIAFSRSPDFIAQASRPSTWPSGSTTSTGSRRCGCSSPSRWAEGGRLEHPCITHPLRPGHSSIRGDVLVLVMCDG